MRTDGIMVYAKERGLYNKLHNQWDICAIDFGTLKRREAEILSKTATK
jgi:hypothetical protein